MTAKPDRVIRGGKIPRISKKNPYAATIVCLQRILLDVWGGSRAAMAEDTKLTVGLIVRIISGKPAPQGRAPTAANIGAVIRALPAEHKDDALQLLTLYLQDVADETADGYLVNVEAA